MHKYPPTVSAFSSAANPDEDWTKISDLAERRRIQNRIAQRNYRKKLKKRLEDLERRAASTSESPELEKMLPVVTISSTAANRLAPNGVSAVRASSTARVTRALSSQSKPQQKKQQSQQHQHHHQQQQHKQQQQQQMQQQLWDMRHAYALPSSACPPLGSANLNLSSTSPSPEPIPASLPLPSLSSLQQLQQQQQKMQQAAPLFSISPAPGAQAHPLDGLDLFPSTPGRAPPASPAPIPISPALTSNGLSIALPSGAASPSSVSFEPVPAFDHCTTLSVSTPGLPSTADSSASCSASSTPGDAAVMSSAANAPFDADCIGSAAWIKGEWDDDELISLAPKLPASGGAPGFGYGSPAAAMGYLPGPAGLVGGALPVCAPQPTRQWQLPHQQQPQQFHQLQVNGVLLERQVSPFSDPFDSALSVSPPESFLNFFNGP